MEGQTASTLIVGVPRETAPGERRVAMTPDTVKRLTATGVVVKVESSAGLASGHSDDAYVAAGATIVPDAAEAFDARVVIKVQRPDDSEVALLRPGTTVIALLQPMTNVDLMRELAARDITAFSMGVKSASGGAVAIRAGEQQLAGDVGVDLEPRGRLQEPPHRGLGVVPLAPTAALEQLARQVEAPRICAPPSPLFAPTPNVRSGRARRSCS